MTDAPKPEPNKPSVIVTINHTYYLERLIEKIAGHLADLNHGMRAVEAGELSGAIDSRVNQFVKIQYNVDVLKGADQRHTYKCCRAVISDVVGFIDAMIAIRRATESGVPITRALRDDVEIRAYVDRFLDATIQKVSADQSLTAPRKIDSVRISSKSSESAKAYFKLRNALEHHNGIPKEDINLTLTQLQMITTSGEVITGPMILKEGEGVAVRIHSEERVFTKGQRIVLSEDDIRRLAFTLENIAREIVTLETQETGTPPTPAPASEPTP